MWMARGWASFGRIGMGMMRNEWWVMGWNCDNCGVECGTEAEWDIKNNSDGVLFAWTILSE